MIPILLRPLAPCAQLTREYLLVMRAARVFNATHTDRFVLLADVCVCARARMIESVNNLDIEFNSLSLASFSPPLLPLLSFR